MSNMSCSYPFLTVWFVFGIAFQGVVLQVWVFEANWLAIQQSVFIERSDESSFAYYSVGFIVRAAKNWDHEPTRSVIVCHMGVHALSFFAVESVVICRLHVLAEAAGDIIRAANIELVSPAVNKGINTLPFRDNLI